MLQLAPESAPVAVQHVARRRLWVISLVVGVTASVVSLIGSWIPSLWGDEAASVLSAQRPLGSLFMMLGHVDAVHGFYYLGLHFWVGVAGSSPFAVRLPSAIAVGVAAAAVSWLCGRLGSTRLAVLAGAIAVVLPRLTYAGEEARAYAFDAGIAAVLCVIVAEVVLRHGRSIGLWVAYGLVLTLGIYSFLYVGLMALAAGVFVLATPSARRHLRGWAIATGAAVLGSTPLLVFAFLERNQVSYLHHRVEVTPSSVLVQMWFGAVPFAIVAWALIAVAIVVPVVKAVRRRLAGTTMAGQGHPSVVVLAACWLFIPVGLLIMSSPLIAGYTARYGTFAAPAAAVLMACGIEAIGKRVWMRVAAAAVVVATALPVWVGQRAAYAMNESDWNEIASTVHAKAQQSDGIVFDEAVRPSRRTRLAMDTDPAAFDAVKDVTLSSPYADNPTWHDDTYTVTQAADLGHFSGIDRVWVVEYSTGAHTDTWGISSLEALGYHRTIAYTEHRSIVYLFTR
ncbi:MAG TPA: glycosyltransferase family 39 protein [Humibacter sp.]|nr:glycosyltransferase family 39 protein [Humibacter sp.]